jgi:hypothetical protein
MEASVVGHNVSRRSGAVLHALCERLIMNAPSFGARAARLDSGRADQTTVCVSDVLVDGAYCGSNLGMGA